MADLTSDFNGLLKAHEAPPTKPYTLSQTDEFLNEAHRISTLVTTLHTSLRSLRQSYLSTAAPRKSHLRTSSRSSQPQPVSLTDRDREEIDANAKRTFRDLSARIRALEDAEQLRQSTESALITKKYARGLGGALGSWAAGGIKSGAKKSAEHLAAEGRARQLGAHRESVILYLRSQLGEAVKTQQGMMETRLTREVEKSRSVLAKARGPGMGGIPEVGMGMPRRTSVGQQQSRGLPEEEGRARGMGEITEEQMQMFEKGNQDMLRHYESTLDKVRTAEQSLVEISELQNLLVNNLATQSAHIDQLVAESFETTEGVGKGNKELKKSTERASPARYTFFAAAGLCTFLVVWDLII